MVVLIGVCENLDAICEFQRYLLQHSCSTYIIFRLVLLMEILDLNNWYYIILVFDKL